MDCYLRFTSDNYDAKDIHNKFSNLTNASINKENMKAKQEDDIEHKDGLKIDGNMWFSSQFSQYLNMIQADTGYVS